MRRTLMLLVALVLVAAPARADTRLPDGFAETTVWSGLTTPTVVRFAPDGRVFVASKSGLIYTFDSLDDPTPTVFADLRREVYDSWDRGLLGMALDPTRQYVYVLYAYDKAPGSLVVPAWGDDCPTPPGPTTDGCTIMGRLSRLDVSGRETVLLEGFCQQYPSHSVGSLEFGPDGQLYVSSGEGASFDWADYGQRVNSCGDPPGTPLRPPTAQGGALRAQSFRRPASQAAVLNGAILRLNPDTGAASAGNPAISNPDPIRRRIIAYGFRNPFRFTFRPGTSEIWAGDVGWNSWEELNRIPDISRVRNYGWPCYEGAARMGAYDAQDLDSCETLYADGAGAVVPPYFSYQHLAPVSAADTCSSASSAVSGLHFYTGNQFPAAYRDALFFNDFGRNCIWVAFKGADGLPDMSTVRTFAAGAPMPVWLAEGPDGALYYADVFGGTVRRIAALNQSPVARISASPLSGVSPLKVTFDGTGSADPEGETLRYEWDLDGNGSIDSTAARPTFTYTGAGVYTVRLRVYDPGNRVGTTTESISVGTAPTLTISAPTASQTWAVGDSIAFAGAARDGNGARLPITWSLVLRHCARTDPNACHSHAVKDWVGVDSGSFTTPDHEYPSHLELTASAIDGSGLRTTRTVRLDPRTVKISLASDPPGMQLSLGSDTLTAPFAVDVIAGSLNSLTASVQQDFQDASWTWAGWSDGLGATHQIVAPPAGTASLTARYTRPPRTSLAGAEIVGPHAVSAAPGFGGIYYMDAFVTGVAHSVRLYVDGASGASRIDLAVYSNVEGAPGTVLGRARIDAPRAGAWNAARLSVPIAMESGRGYWLALLNPPGSGGTLVFRDKAGARQLAQTTADGGIAALPDVWVSAPGHWHIDGYLSGGAWAEDVVDPVPPLATSPVPSPTSIVAGDAPPFASPPRLVGAWGFDERSGGIASDASGTGNVGVLNGPRHVAGRFGKGLSFDGRNDWVTVRDSPSLQSVGAVEAWVFPTKRGGRQSVAIKETQRGLAWALYTSGGRASTPREAGAPAKLPLRRWSHLAVTYDGSAFRVFVNGVLVSSRAQRGSLVSSRYPLRFGGNAVWPEWFKGRLDEVRIYADALSADQIRADMTRPIAGPTIGRGAAGDGVGSLRYRARTPHAH